MNNDKKHCSKCSSDNLWIPQGSPSSDFEQINIDWRNFFSITKLICLDCGFIDMYVNLEGLNDKKMKRVEEKWRRVNKDE